MGQAVAVELADGVISFLAFCLCFLFCHLACSFSFRGKEVRCGYLFCRELQFGDYIFLFERVESFLAFKRSMADRYLVDGSCDLVDICLRQRVCKLTVEFMRTLQGFLWSQDLRCRVVVNKEAQVASAGATAMLLAVRHKLFDFGHAHHLQAVKLVDARAVLLFAGACRRLCPASCLEAL